MPEALLQRLDGELTSPTTKESESLPQTGLFLTDLAAEVEVQAEPQDIYDELTQARETAGDIYRQLLNTSNLRQNDPTPSAALYREGHISEGELLAALPRLQSLMAEPKTLQQVSAYDQERKSGRAFQKYQELRQLMTLIEIQLDKLGSLERKKKIEPESSRFRLLLQRLNNILRAIKH
jgi:hypothetical protein